MHIADDYISSQAFKRWLSATYWVSKANRWKRLISRKKSRFCNENQMPINCHRKFWSQKIWKSFLSNFWKKLMK
jgi:hypothetical protein